MVHSFDQQDFRIFDKGMEQKITHFDVGGDLLSLVILVENSSRVESILPELRKTGILFSEQVLGPSGEAAVVAFNDSVDKLLDFSADPKKLEKTFSHLRVGTSGSRLYDAMSIGVEMLTSRAGTASATETGGGARRRVLVVLSEATDDGSSAKLGEVLRAAQLANVAIYSVGLSTLRAELNEQPRKKCRDISPPGTFPLPPQPGTPQTPESEAQRQGNIDLLALAAYVVQHAKDKIMDHALEIATAATGGMHVPTFKDRSIERAIDEIGGELHAQYTLSYTPANPEEFGYHEIEVRLSRKGFRVRHRPGYYLTAPEN